MTICADRDYYRQRASEERSQAARSDDPCARKTHLRMAKEYERRIALDPVAPRLTA
jgi:hypothetical protein